MMKISPQTPLLAAFTLCSLTLATAIPSTAQGEPLAMVQGAYTGRYKFVFVGASMADSEGLDNGVHCLKSSASTVVAAADIPSRAKVISARLYVGGSLIDDGPDSPGESIFSNGGLMWSNQADQPQILNRALADADRSVTFHPPGSVEPITVTAPSDAPHVAIFWNPPPSPEQGNVGFFVTPIDVTDAINNAGRGVIAGTYSVAELRADLCNGTEASCDATGSAASCQTVSGTHTKGAASFALLLVIEDPSLPLATIGIFEGIELLTAGLSTSLGLDTGSIVSAPGAGALAFYALEGDLKTGVPATPAGSRPPCDAHEYIEVDGDLDPDNAGLCLSDADNPIGNLFNSTINVQAPQTPVTPPAECTTAPETAYGFCCGDNVCGETGVDIDRFDISDALEAGATEVLVRIGTAADTIALGVVALSVGLFEPMLEVDSQIRVLNAVGGNVRVGDSIDYSIAISNTGNVDATGVKLFMDAPANTSAFEVLRMPRGASDLSQPLGGLHQTGLLRIEGIVVPAGEIAETRLRLQVDCGTLNRPITATAQIRQTVAPTFEVEAPIVVGRGPVSSEHDHCPDADPTGPFGAGALLSERRLAGGGGCNSTGENSALSAMLILLGMFWRRRRSARTYALALAFSTVACAERHKAADQEPDPGPRNITSLDGLDGDICGDATMVFVRRLDGSRFCIDRLEASVDGASLGPAHPEPGNDLRMTADSGAQTMASVALNVFPAVNVSWYQAVAACSNAGKRLCTLQEWERACRGPTELIFPYGDNLDDDACNGFFNYAAVNPSVTGSLASCGSHWGVYDMSGNVEEWVFDAIPRSPDETDLRDRSLRGGSHRSNSSSLACVGGEFHAAPGDSDDDRGFRCCSDAL